MEEQDIAAKIIETDVEVEDEGVSNIKIPFSPNDVKVKTQPMNIGDLVDRLEYEEIMLDTEFQRSSNLWSIKKQSRLIESILLKLPIPTFYFDESEEHNWRVIDGLQRLCTFKNYIVDKSIALSDLEFLKQHEGLKFDELPRELQRRIKTFPLLVYILEKGTPDIVKYNIFSRINEGGLVLTAQEMRHALHQGIAADLVKDLVSNETPYGKSFQQATMFRIKNKRMEDRDYATRFLAFYITSYEKYEPDLNYFLHNGMSKVQRWNEAQVAQLKLDFQKSMQTAISIFEEDAFRKRFKKEDGRKPINKALFEVISVAFAKLSNSEIKKLIENKEIFKEKFIGLHSEDRFIRAISQGTALKENVELRHRAIERIIKETLHD